MLDALGLVLAIIKCKRFCFFLMCDDSTPIRSLGVIYKRHNELCLLFRDVGDVDLFTAGVSEIPVHLGAVGPTFGNILAKQFKALKKGDRYWYETNERPQAFTESELLGLLFNASLSIVLRITEMLL